MAEYIDRETVIKSLEKLCDRVCQYSKAQRNVMCSSCPLGDAFTVIEDDIPTADVKPVVRSHWKKNDNGTYSCERCHSWIPEEQRHYANWCLYCGADMREGDAE